MNSEAAKLLAVHIYIYTNHFNLQLTPTLALVLLYDFLLGKGICCGGPLKRMVHKHKVILKQLYLELSSKKSSAAATSPIEGKLSIDQE